MKLCLKMTGCRNNRYELDQILSWAIQNGISIVKEKEADYCIINTCTVTHVADRKSRQMIRRTKNGNKKLKTIVFGCAARMQKEEFEKIEEIDYMFKNLEEVIGFLTKQFNKQRRHRSMSPSDENEMFRARPLIQIQDGCDNYCTYCIIATARWEIKKST